MTDNNTGKIWAIADLHLSFGVPEKSMDLFGPAWKDHAARIEKHWREKVSDRDLVLLPGDISWAMRIAEAAPDIDWIAALPGTKVMIRGNHDYWWTSVNKVRKVLPDRVHIVQNDAFNWNGVSVGGARLWDTPEFNFDPYIEYRENPKQREKVVEHQAPEVMARIYERELHRLELSLQQLDQKASVRIVMTHYPPVDAEMNRSLASALFEKYNVDICLFGHLHNVLENALPYGEARGVRYQLVSCDYINCDPVLVG
jgi:predicted phosphohydrolase